MAGGGLSPGTSETCGGSARASPCRTSLRAHCGRGMQAVGLCGAWRGRAVVPMAKPPCGVRRIADMLSGTWNKAGDGPHQLGSSLAFPRGSWPQQAGEGG